MENGKSLFKQNSELMGVARAKLKGNWGTAILISFVFSVICGILGAIPFIGSIAALVITGPLMLGLLSCFVHLVRNEPFRIENLFDGFKRFTPAFLLQLLVGIFTMLWSILLIVPGVIAALSYSMSFFILNDNPEMTAMEAIKASKAMMNGYKLKLFLMGLVFYVLMLLSAITLFIGMLWLIPFMYTCLVAFYEEIKDNPKTV